MEIGGVEPPSKQGTNMLSTCLSPPSIFVLKQDRSHQLAPYLLLFRLLFAAKANYSVYFCTSISVSPQTRLGEMSRFSTLCRNQANLLYFGLGSESIRIVASYILQTKFNEHHLQCSACLHTCSTCCQNQISPLHFFRRQK